MAAITEAQPETGRRFDFGAFLHRFGTLGIFIVLVIAASFWSPSFLTKPNILNFSGRSHRAQASWRSECFMSF